MRKILSLLLIALILFISGCAQQSRSYDRNFKGSSEHWTAIYTVKGSSINHESKYKLIYNGSNLASVGKVKYFLSSGTEEFKGEQSLSKEGFILGTSGGNGAVTPKDAEIDVIIEWNGQAEKFKLTPVGIPIQI